jgi:hypothetical protein
MGQQGKLGDDQQFSTDRIERQVHLPGIVREDPHPKRAIRHELGIRLGISLRDTQQNHQAAADFPDPMSAYPDLSAANPLKNCSHDYVLMKRGALASSQSRVPFDPPGSLL